MSIAELPLWCLALLSLTVLPGLWAMAMLSAAHLRQRRPLLLLPDVTLLLLGFTLFQAAVGPVQMGQGALLPPFQCRLQGAPAWVLLLAVPVFLWAVLWTALGSLKWRRDHLTPQSLAEGLNAMPEGVCYALLRGQPRLVNPAMDRIARAVTGEPLLDALDFWEKLVEGRVAPGVRRIGQGEPPLYRTAEGRVYSFRRERKEDKRGEIWELLAADLTEEYETSRELREKKARLEAMNARLNFFSQQVVGATIEKEILAAKVRLHDRLGQASIAARRYLSAKGGDREAVRQLLLDSATLLRQQAPETVSDDYAATLQAARDVGVRFVVRGVLPQAREQKAVLSTAMHECLTNTIRHAQGDEVYLRLSTEPDGSVTAAFTNNGIPPRELEESGGLGHLRRMTEAMGGEMRIETAPRFTLILRLPPAESALTGGAPCPPT